MQETQVRCLIQEDPTWLRATKLVHGNYWACSLELRSHNYRSPCTLEPVLRIKRSHRNEKPMHCNWRKACVVMKTAQAKVHEFLKNGPHKKKNVERDPCVCACVHGHIHRHTHTYTHPLLMRRLKQRGRSLSTVAALSSWHFEELQRALSVKRAKHNHVIKHISIWKKFFWNSQRSLFQISSGLLLSRCLF